MKIFVQSSALVSNESEPSEKLTGRESVFHKEFREDLQYWVQTDRKTALKILTLMEAVMRDPSIGKGNPELMNYMGSDVWTRRITQEHRLVYTVSDDRIEFLQARYNYER